MRVAMGEEAAAADAATSAEGDMLVPAVVPILAEVVAATVELGLADQLARMRQGLIHPESQPAALAGTGKGTTHRKRRLERRFIAQVQGHKIGPLPGSLLVRRIIPVATTSREINRELALLENPTCSPGIIREQIAMFASNAPE
jgi:hypothetical protein